MNREIKFRAWDGMRMLYGVENTYDTIVEYTDKDGEKVNQADTNIVSARSFGELLNIRDVSLMQYTGIKDKNKKEIYEGDIVEHDASSAGIPNAGYRRCVVEYRAPDFIPHQLSNISGYDCEVVGNIYENPDLVK